MPQFMGQGMEKNRELLSLLHKTVSEVKTLDDALDGMKMSEVFGGSKVLNVS